MYFCSNLVYLRRRESLSQSNVAKNVNLGTNTIGSYERGDREPTLENLINLAKFYNVSIDELLLTDLRPKGAILGKNLRYLRKSEGYTQKDFSKLMGIEDAAISKYETGMINPSTIKLINLSEFFGVTVDQLLKEDLSEGGK